MTAQLCSVTLGTSPLFSPKFGHPCGMPVKNRGRSTSKDFAACLNYLSNALPEADQIILVMDNLNTHKEASLYEAFPSSTARELCERFEFHCTPKHGSWLNMAKIEIGLFVRGCLDRRIGSEKVIRRKVAAYLERKNENKTYQLAIHQRKARIKLKTLYPAV